MMVFKITSSVSRRYTVFTIIVFVAGWFLGRNWDQAKAFFMNKLAQSSSADGGTRRLDDD